MLSLQRREICLDLVVLVELPLNVVVDSDKLLRET